MYRILVIPFISLLLLFNSCSTDISQQREQTLAFQSLPDTVKAIYRDYSMKTDNSLDYYVISTNPSISFKHKHTGMDDGIFTLITQGFNHHFYVNGKHFILQANQGDPFILHENHLYYTLELNLDEYNYKSAQYVSVNLGKLN